MSRDTTKWMRAVLLAVAATVGAATGGYLLDGQRMSIKDAVALFAACALVSFVFGRLKLPRAKPWRLDEFLNRFCVLSAGVAAGASLPTERSRTYGCIVGLALALASAIAAIILSAVANRKRVRPVDRAAPS